MSKEQTSLLKKLYYNLKNSGSFSGIGSLYLSAKKIDDTISRKFVEKWLRNQNVYLRHKRDRKPRGKARQYNKWVVSNKNLDFACDSGNFPSSKLPYLLVCRDTFTNKLLARQQRGLKAETTKKNFQKLIEIQNNSVYPHTIYTDRGNEFKLFNTLPIAKHQTTENPNQKSYLAEKSIATIRGKLNRYATYVNRKVDLSEALPHIIQSINTTPVTLTNLSPLESEQLGNAGITYDRKYSKFFDKKRKSLTQPRFPIHSFVRISIPDKNSFLKKSKPGFSQETFVVSKIRDTVPPTYEVTDSDGQVLQGYFHPENLLKAEVNVENWRLIDRTLDKRQLKTGQFEYLVNFVGHNRNYTRWLDEKQYLKLKSSFPERLNLDDSNDDE